jgi:hypothetical protein
VSHQRVDFISHKIHQIFYLGKNFSLVIGTLNAGKVQFSFICGIDQGIEFCGSSLQRWKLIIGFWNGNFA